MTVALTCAFISFARQGMGKQSDVLTWITQLPIKNIRIINFQFFYRLKSIDLVCMKKLDTKVNIIPIIAKADTISKTELQKFKVSFDILLHDSLDL